MLLFSVCDSVILDCRWCFFFFQAEDGIRDLVRSRGLGDVYKRQGYFHPRVLVFAIGLMALADVLGGRRSRPLLLLVLSLIHI